MKYSRIATPVLQSRMYLTESMALFIAVPVAMGCSAIYLQYRAEEEEERTGKHQEKGAEGLGRRLSQHLQGLGRRLSQQLATASPTTKAKEKSKQSWASVWGALSGVLTGVFSFLVMCGYPQVCSSSSYPDFVSYK